MLASCTNTAKFFREINIMRVELSIVLIFPTVKTFQTCEKHVVLYFPIENALDKKECQWMRTRREPSNFARREEKKTFHSLFFETRRKENGKISYTSRNFPSKISYARKENGKISYTSRNFPSNISYARNSPYDLIYYTWDQSLVSIN